MERKLEINDLSFNEVNLAMNWKSHLKAFINNKNDLNIKYKSKNNSHTYLASAPNLLGWCKE